MTEEVNEHRRMNSPEIPDSRVVAQQVDDILFLWEEAGSVENPITIDEDEGFSETMTPPIPQQPLQSRPALRSIENLQNSRQLFDQKFLVKKCCLVLTLFFVINYFLQFHFNYENR